MWIKAFEHYIELDDERHNKLEQDEQESLAAAATKEEEEEEAAEEAAAQNAAADKQLVTRAIEEQLVDLDFLNTKDLGLDEDSYAKAAGLNLQPRDAVVLIMSPNFDCSSEIASILAMLDATDRNALWLLPEESEKAKFEQKQTAAQHPTGIHLSLLFIYMRWRGISNVYSAEDQAQWCKENFLSITVLRAADSFRVQLVQQMKNTGIPIKKMSLDDDSYCTKILRALCEGYFDQAAMLIPGKTTYEIMKSGLSASLAKSVQLGSHHSDRDWVIYRDASTSGGEIALNKVSFTRPEWLMQANPRFFDLRCFTDGPSKAALLRVWQNLVGKLPNLDGPCPDAAK